MPPFARPALAFTSLNTWLAPRVASFNFNGPRYPDLALSAFVGETVTIRYDPRDIAEIRVWHQDTFLCRAIDPELVAGSVTFKQPNAARSRRLGTKTPHGLCCGEA